MITSDFVFSDFFGSKQAIVDSCLLISVESKILCVALHIVPEERFF